MNKIITDFTLDLQLNKIQDVLSRLGKEADKERVGDALVKPEDRMLAITADTGMFFGIILKMIQAKMVLEVGTSTGYSTLWLADALHTSSDRSIITIEENSSKIKRARKNFDDAGVSDFIEIRQGKAKDVLSKMLEQYQIDKKPQFDFVLLDADKENCIDYFELVLPMLRVGGVIAADNILHPESCIVDMARYTEHVKNKSNVQSVTVPIGNGEEITIKTK